MSRRRRTPDPLAPPPRPGAAAAGLLVALAAAVGVLPAAAPAAAQAPEEATADAQGPSEIFVDTVRVDLVDVDVYVTDKQGRPVTGLTAEDFEVFEDGRPVAVSNFYAVEAGRPLAPEPAEAPPGEPAPLDGSAAPAAAAPPTGPELPETQRLWLIVYIDNFNLKPLDRNRVLPALRTFLYDRVEPGDRAMVVSYDRELHVRQPFTDDSRLLIEALEDLEDVTGHLSARDRERADVLRTVNDTESAVLASAAARSYADSVLNDLESTAASLREFVDSLAGLPGRKALLYVSSSLPLIAGEELFHAVEGKFPSSYALREMPRYDVSRSFERVAAKANEGHVAFYTLDAGGLRVHTFGTAEYPELTTFGLRMHLDAVLQESVQSGMRFVAYESGGEAILNLNEALPALDRIGEQLDTFYSLGYQSSSAADGRYHRIEVEVRRPGVKVRHREGYRAKSVIDRMSESVRAALMHSYESNGLEVKLAVGRGEPQGGDLYRVPMQVEIPLREVTFLPRPDGRWEARMKLFIGAVDDAGRFSPIEQVPLGLRIAGDDLEAARGEALLHPHRLLMRSGRQRIALGVFDELGGESGLVWHQLQVGG